MAELHWFPFMVKDWLSSPTVQAMLPEQRGAYIQLLALAWGNGEVEPSLPNNDRDLAHLSGLQRRWKSLGAKVREQFTESGGRLYNAKLSEVWFSQIGKHSSAVDRGHKGAKVKAKLKLNDSSALSSASDRGSANGKHPEPEPETTSPSSSARDVLPERLAREIPESDHQFVKLLLSRVSFADPWLAEMNVALDGGMHYPKITGAQLGKVVRQFMGNTNGPPNMGYFLGHIGREARGEKTPPDYGKRGGSSKLDTSFRHLKNFADEPEVSVGK